MTQAKAIIRRFAGTVVPALLAAAPTYAAEITEPSHGVTLVYKEAQWSAKLDDQDISLTCTSDACGGPDSECKTLLTMTKPGFTVRAFFGTFQNEFTDNLVEEYNKLGVDPVIVDAPTSFKVGNAITSLSSVRYTEGGTPARAWFASQEASFGVVTLSCHGDEDKFETAKTAWLDLAKGIVLPKK